MFSILWEKRDIMPKWVSQFRLPSLIANSRSAQLPTSNAINSQSSDKTWYESRTNCHSDISDLVSYLWTQLCNICVICVWLQLKRDLFFAKKQLKPLNLCNLLRQLPVRAREARASGRDRGESMTVKWRIHLSTSHDLSSVSRTREHAEWRDRYPFSHSRGER